MKYIMTGGNSGLGLAIASELDRWGHDVRIWDLPAVDVTSQTSISNAIGEEEGQFYGIINCAGVNKLDWIEDIEFEDWNKIMNVNARSLWLTARELICAQALTKPGLILNIVSNASHKPMRTSAAYNASKAAAHMLTLQMARELGPRHGLTVFGISPNRLSGTGMSHAVDQRTADLRGWSPEETRARQLDALPTGEETPPEAVADFIGYLLSSRERHMFLHGTVIPYGG